MRRVERREMESERWEVGDDKREIDVALKS